MFTETGNSYSYTETNRIANRVGKWAIEQGLQKGHTVALMMDNRPEFLWTLLGLSKVGVQVAMLNVHIRGKSLVHCIHQVNCRHLIVGSELASAIEEIRSELKDVQIEIYRVGSPCRGGLQRVHIGPREHSAETFRA